MEGRYMGYSKALADFAAGLRIEDLSADVIDASTRAILDCFGVAAFGTTTEWAGLGRRYVQQYGHPGSSIVIAASWTASPRDAAVLNGLFMHGFELDDTHVPSSSHPGCAVIPAAL